MKTRYIHLLILLFITIAKSAAMPIPADLKPIFVQHNPQQIDVAALLALNHQRYRQDIYYGMDILLQDANQNEYFLSTPRAKNHLLAQFLDNKNALSYLFTASHCTQQTCTSQTKGSSFATFQFQGNDVSDIRPQNPIHAKCDYEGTYRRKYPDKTKIEFVFKPCQIVTLNDKPQPILLDETNSKENKEEKTLLSNISGETFGKWQYWLSAIVAIAVVGLIFWIVLPSLMLFWHWISPQMPRIVAGIIIGVVTTAITQYFWGTEPAALSGIVVAIVVAWLLAEQV
ncbi:MAG: hypothetical protein DRR16_30800 [Candidatus Parabeggiatoa sp. nov. 3]|jgi:hypothetical protein|nr:MAG: hypothetical protein DRR00_12285 [Gammaproteobacteria bacterium]RKZ66742.1 MAG: hypothetical protein DRQ99_08650 [Gammaproteobacteria bacterium]RKZ75982.1 MAG: hypothetical protein DRR16_30800 [Gammaproteobacteria bacterium]